MMQRLQGTIQTYAWGSTDFLPALLGQPETGEQQAELWLGAHPSAPSLVADRPLDQLIGEDPEATLGPAVVAEFGPMLPYLLKVLSAAEPLSLQAHPSRAQAEAGFAAEEAAGVDLGAPERTYRDDWPKPEMLCALETTDLLCGFREPRETYDLFERLGVPAAVELVAPLRDGGASELAEVFAQIMRLSGAQLSLVGEVARAAGQLGGDGQIAAELGARYPEDPGVLAALLMNRMTLQRNEAVFLDAGNLHAYVSGSGVEIMANSNNVLRGGLTSKHVNLGELLKILDFTPGFPALVSCVEERSGAWAYQTPASEFALWRLEVSSEVLVPATGTPRVLLVYEGSMSARAATAELGLARGQSAFLSAGEDVELIGDGTAFLAGPGVPDMS